MSRATAGERPAGPWWRTLPAALRLLLLGDLITALGIGLTQPYLVILLHVVKDVPLATATAMTSLLALASFPGNWLSGVVTDRLGGHGAMTAGLVTSMLGLAVIAYTDGPVPLGAGIAAVGFGWSVTLPAYSALIAALVPEAGQGRAFTLQYGLLNLGMGAGAAAGALVTHRTITESMSLLWWIAAVTCAVAVLTNRLSHRVSPPAVRRPEPGRERETGGYRVVLADRTLLRVLLAAVLTATAGYGVYESGLPVLAVAGGDPAAMSWASVANCLTIVAGLPLALRLAERWTPPRLLALTAVAWSAAWLICLVEAWSAPLGARTALCLAAALVGVGELVMSGALPSMVNTLAPDALRGRYNALLTLMLTTGMWAGPMLAAAVTAADRVWLLFAGAVLLLAAMAVLVHRPSLAAAVPALGPAAPGGAGSAVGMEGAQVGSAEPGDGGANEAGTHSDGGARAPR